MPIRDGNDENFPGLILTRQSHIRVLPCKANFGKNQFRIFIHLNLNEKMLLVIQNKFNQLHNTNNVSKYHRPLRGQ